METEINLGVEWARWRWGWKSNPHICISISIYVPPYLTPRSLSPPLSQSPSPSLSRSISIISTSISISMSILSLISKSKAIGISPLAAPLDRIDGDSVDGCRSYFEVSFDAPVFEPSCMVRRAMLAMEEWICPSVPSKPKVSVSNEMDWWSVRK